MYRISLAVALCLVLTSVAIAKKCCVCCVQRCETPPVSPVPPPESAVGCGDVRQAPTCRSIKPARCKPRIANGVEPDALQAATRA